MKNPWKLKPVLICATPIAGALLQVIILGFSTATADTARRNALNEVITVGVLFLPLVSVPALSAAVWGFRTGATRGWYVAGAVLNSLYCLLLSVPILTIFTYLIHGARR
jgi:hypothetical protein